MWAVRELNNRWDWSIVRYDECWLSALYQVDDNRTRDISLELILPPQFVKLAYATFAMANPNVSHFAYSPESSFS